MGNVCSKAWTLVQHFARAVRPGSPVASTQSERHLNSLYRLIAFMDVYICLYHVNAALPSALVSTGIKETNLHRVGNVRLFTFMAVSDGLVFVAEQNNPVKTISTFIHTETPICGHLCP